MTGADYMGAAFAHLGQVLETLYEDDRHLPEPEERWDNCKECGEFRRVDALGWCLPCIEGEPCDA